MRPQFLLSLLTGFSARDCNLKIFKVFFVKFSNVSLFTGAKICLVLLFISSCDFRNLRALCDQEVLVVNTTEVGADPGALCPPGEPCTLRSALLTAAFCAGTKTIRLQSGATYTLNTEYVQSSRDLLHNDRVGRVMLPRIFTNVIIEGEGEGATIEIPSFQFGRLFHVTQGGNLTLRNLTLRGGSPQAVYNEGYLTLDNVTFEGNREVHAVYNKNILNEDSPPNLIARNCEFRSNSGGAIHNDEGGVAEIDNCDFLRNRYYMIRRDGGAALRITGGGVTVLNGTKFSDNTSYQYGSSIFINSGRLDVRASTFENDPSSTFESLHPEPMYINGSTARVTIDQCTFTRNYGRQAGCINLINGNLTITRSTFYQNTTGSSGGAIFSFGNLTLKDVTIHQNIARSKGAVAGINIAGGTAEISNSVISNNLPQNYGVTIPIVSHHVNISTDGTHSAFRVISDPNFEGGLRNNGGLTETLLPAASSPLVNAGTDNMPRQDQRNGKRPVGGAVDVGAVERQ